MIDIDIQLDVDAVRDYLVDDVQKQQLPKATASALNKVALKVQNRAVRLIAEDIGFTSVYGKRGGDNQVKKHLRRKRASWKNLLASIVPNHSKRVAVNALKPKQTASGVDYTGLGGIKKHIPHAFIQTMRVANKPGVYKRKGKARFPVQFLRTVSIPEVFIKQRIEKALVEVAAERWGQVFPREVNYYLNR